MQDLTAIFQDAADSLTFRDAMICDRDSFNLQDSMAALEIMDRKMDCCEVPTSEVAPFGRETSEEDKNRMVFPRPLPTGLDDVVDPFPWNELTLEDVAYIALQCLSRLESLLSGASVIESTYTCLYAHESVMTDMKAALDPSQSEILSEKMQGLMAVDPDESQRHLPQRVLFASMLLLLDLTDVLRNVSLSADIFEEEDFTVSTYNAPTFGDRTDDSSIEAAKVALSDLSTLSQKDSDVVQAIRFMLEFQVEFLNVIDTMSKLGSKDVRKEAEKSQRLIRATALKLEKLSLIAQRLKKKEKDSTKAILKRIFDSFATLPLVGNAPVRNIRFLDTDKAIASLIKTTKELDWAVCGLLLNGNSLGRIRRMLARISLASPNIISRSLLVLNLFFDDQLLGQYSLSLMIMRHMQQLSRVPDDVFQTTTSQAFLGRLAKPVYDILKLMILNRNRQRAYVEVIILPDWGVLSQEAAVADTALKHDPKFGPDTLPHFSSYALHLTVECMDHFVALGIELGLYCSGYELFCAYWYRDFLLSALLSQLGMMRKTRLLAREMQQAALASASAKRGKKKGGKANKKPTQANTKADVEDIEDDLEFILASLKRVLCRGLMRVSATILILEGWRWPMHCALLELILRPLVLCFRDSSWSARQYRI